ncbi:hypothetical protein MVEN_00061200 [Mycena venus]|uniref:Uncharacterized protein n=1 Tax=Mycena venus TaxID=2733690 RepID=A0A8H6Z6T4_9AGAR|nr:hypothetical protein MVEN_00061200 [Mycena venus]
MAQGQTDETKPPLYRFFDANQRIKTVPTLAAQTLTPGTPAAPVTSAVPAVPAVTGSSLSLIDLFFASLLSQPGGVGLTALLPGLGAGLPTTPPSVPPSIPPTKPRSARPSSVKRHTVTTDRFCEIYGIDEGDCGLLKEVGFPPGDPTESTLDEELKKVGFTLFSWKRIHSANLRFKVDLAAGGYD